MESGVSSSWLGAWLDPKGEFNQSAVVWLGGWSALAVALVVLLIAVALYLTWRSSSKLSQSRRALLMSLRALSSGALFVLFLQPTARLEDVTRVKNHVAVLIDDSRSMSLPGESGASRWEEALAELRAHQGELRALEDDHIVSLYRFHDHLSAVGSLQELSAEGPRGEATLRSC